MRVGKAVLACARDVSGLTEFVIGACSSTCFISNDTM